MAVVGSHQEIILDFLNKHALPSESRQLEGRRQVAAVRLEQENWPLKEALEVLHEDARRATDVATYASLLQQCREERALSEGRLLHAHIRKSQHSGNTFLGNLLVEMYGKCGSIQEACAVFESMSDRTVVSWNIMVAAFAKNKHNIEAVELFRKLELEGVRPNKVTYLNTLNACASLRVEAGKEIHARIAESGYDADVVVANSLVNMYGKCSCLSDARTVFRRIQDKDVVSWNCLLSAYARNGHSTEVLELFQDMDRESIKPDKVTYLTILDACARLGALEQGRRIHRCILDDNLDSDTVVGNALLNMYGKCRSVEDAANIFDQMPHRNVVTWTAMISVNAQNGHCKEALQVFRKMDMEGIRASMVTFVSTLDACADLEALEQGRILHARIVEAGWAGSNVIVGNSLMNVYAKCRSLVDARSMFEVLRHGNLVAWNTLMTMYVKEERNEDALQLFRRMDQEGMKPDMITYLTIVGALVGGSAECEAILARISDNGWQTDAVVGNAILSLHCKYGNVEDARHIFDNISRTTVITWTAMVCGYAENGHGKEALKLFRKMDKEGIKPDEITFIGVVDACASLPSLAEGRAIHIRIESTGSELGTNLGNSLVNMYGRCGSLGYARKTFVDMRRDLVSWNSIIAAYAQNGHGKEAVELFQEMNVEGIEPDYITFLGVFFGCSNSGLLDDGQLYLNSMSADYALTPRASHYGCMIDLLGKAGWLDRAENLISSMPFEPDARAWLAMLGACKTHGDVERGELAARRIVEMEAAGTIPYVLLSNIYSLAGRWDDAAKVRSLIDGGVHHLQLSWSQLKHEIEVAEKQSSRKNSNNHLADEQQNQPCRAC